MSKLTFELKRVDTKEKGHYFVVVQLDETEYPSKLVRTQKFRTEIDYSTEFPQFHKNYFEFTKVSLGNKLVFRIGLFAIKNINAFDAIMKGEQNETNNEIHSKTLFTNSILLGSCDILLGESWMDKLRSSKYVESDSKLINAIQRRKETGHAYFKITCRSETLDTKIYENIKEIEKAFYDPFEKDKGIISSKLKSVIILNEEKQIQLKEIGSKLQDINNKFKYAAREKLIAEAELKSENDENSQLKRNTTKLQNYDEIHIEIDLLSQSDQGIAMLEKKYAMLLGQMAIQNQIRMENEEEYKSIEAIMTKLNILKSRMKVIKEANEELKFNHKRHEDMLPLITTYQEKIKNNDKIISNFKENITDILKIRQDNSPLSLDELKKRIEMTNKERKKLEEKKMQMNLLIELYFNENEKRSKTYEELEDPFYRIIGNDPTMNRILTDSEQQVLLNNNKRIEELKRDAKDLAKKIDDFERVEKEKKAKGIVIEPSLIVKRNNLRDKVENEDKRQKFLLEELSNNKTAFNNLKEMMKEKIFKCDIIIDKELKYARLRKYEDDVNMNNYYDDDN